MTNLHNINHRNYGHKILSAPEIRTSARQILEAASKRMPPYKELMKSYTVHDVKLEDLIRSLVSDKGSSAVTCHHCFNVCGGRPRCKYCQSKAYCSEECQTEDWEIHKVFCEKIQKAASEGETGRRISKREVYKDTVALQEKFQVLENLLLTSKMTGNDDAIATIQHYFKHGLENKK
jgi:hypothetical protein